MILLVRGLEIVQHVLAIIWQTLVWKTKFPTYINRIVFVTRTPDCQVIYVVK